MDRLTVAIVPSLAPPGLAAALERFGERLGTALGEPVAAEQAGSYAALVSMLERGRAQFAWMPSVLVVLASERVWLRPVASAVRGELLDYRGALFVDAASPWRSVRDLGGETVAWVDPTSASGYLHPRLHLASLGIDPVRWFGAERFAGSHAGVVREVAERRAAVGATFAYRGSDGTSIERAGFLEVEPDHAMRVLEWTTPIPNDLIVAHGRLPDALVRRFERALYDLGAARGDLLREPFQAQRFAPVRPDALRSVEQSVREARSLGLLAHL